MEKKQNDQDQRIKQLKAINKKLEKKSSRALNIIVVVGTLSFFGFPVLLAQITEGVLIPALIGGVMLGGTYFASMLAATKYSGNIGNNKKLIEKLYIQNETNKLSEENKKMMKEIAQDKELTYAISNISNFSFDVTQAELLKKAVLNKEVLHTMKVLDQKDCVHSLSDEVFDNQKVEQEYNRAIEIGTKPKSLKKAMTETREMFK